MTRPTHTTMRLKTIALGLVASLAFAFAPAGAQVEKAPPVKDTPVLKVVHKAPAKVAGVTIDSFRSPTDVGVWKPANTVVVTVVPEGCYDALCTQLSVSHISRVNAGAAAITGNIASSQVPVFIYAALSTDTATPVLTDTVCPAEITSGGLARQAATYGSYVAPITLNGVASYQMTTSWTATGSFTVAKICMLNASSSGVLGFETLLGAPVSVANTDTINLTWTFNV